MFWCIVGLMAFAGLTILVATLQTENYDDKDRWDDEDWWDD